MGQALCHITVEPAKKSEKNKNTHFCIIIEAPFLLKNPWALAQIAHLVAPAMLWFCLDESENYCLTEWYDFIVWSITVLNLMQMFLILYAMLYFEDRNRSITFWVGSVAKWNSMVKIELKHSSNKKHSIFKMVTLFLNGFFLSSDQQCKSSIYSSYNDLKLKNEGTFPFWRAWSNYFS